MTINYNDLEISIYSNPAYTASSTDNLHNYKKRYFDESDYQFPSIYGIRVKENGEEFSAVIGSGGGATAASEKSVIIEDNKLFMCCVDSIYCLSLPELNLNWNIEVDSCTCFELYKVNDFFIVHGELEISRLSFDGKIEWQRSGRDIFVTIDGKDDFEISNDVIIVKDWENREYKFDFCGNDVS